MKDDYFRAVGKHFGFPDCCVEEFIRDVGTNAGLTKRHRKLYGTGYIPCKKCNEHFSEQQLIANIQGARVHPVPFPHESRHIEQIVNDIAKRVRGQHESQRTIA